MAIQFHPKPGMVLMCHYGDHTLPPEMIKLRRVVIISSEEHNKHGLCTVIPFSTTAPEPEANFHVKFEAGAYSFLSVNKPCWAKCNMVSTVSHQRLDRIRVQGKYSTPYISEIDLLKIHKAHLCIYGKFLKML